MRCESGGSGRPRQSDEGREVEEGREGCEVACLLQQLPFDHIAGVVRVFGFVSLFFLNGLCRQ
jgi:hypothetical protein